MITGDFNARSSNWWSLDKENTEGQEIDSLTSACGYSQTINQPTHMTKESSSCIDLIFTTNTNLISNTGFEYHSLRNVIIVSYMALLILRSHFLHLP